MSFKELARKLNLAGLPEKTKKNQGCKIILRIEKISLGFTVIIRFCGN
jgi:hypothetical protein